MLFVRAMCYIVVYSVHIELLPCYCLVTDIPCVPTCKVSDKDRGWCRNTVGKFGRVFKFGG